MCVTSDAVLYLGHEAVLSTLTLGNQVLVTLATDQVPRNKRLKDQFQILVLLPDSGSMYLGLGGSKRHLLEVLRVMLV